MWSLLRMAVLQSGIIIIISIIINLWNKGLFIYLFIIIMIMIIIIIIIIIVVVVVVMVTALDDDHNS